LDNSPVRTVENNLLVSADMPTITIKVGDSLDFVGRSKFILYDIAEAEIFVFAEAGEGRRLKRRLVVQFEGFLDSNTHTYNYRMPMRMTLGSHEYMVDDFAANLRRLKEEEPADSDGARVDDLLQQAGYTMPDDAIWTRFVRVIGEDRRRELLIIYMEDLKDLGLTSAGMPQDEPLSQEYAPLTNGVHERALRAFTVVEG
jgi:hypothetical protein